MNEPNGSGVAPHAVPTVVAQATLRGLAPGLVTGGPGRSGGAPQEDRRREILLRVLMFFAGLGDFAVLWLLKFRLWAVVAVVVGLLVIDEVLKRLVKGTGQRDRSTDG